MPPFPHNSREFFHQLNLSSHYSGWIKRQIDRFHWIEDVDYRMQPAVAHTPGRPAQTYYLSDAAAKTLAEHYFMFGVAKHVYAHASAS